MITPAIKSKIERIINAFETGKAEGNYAGLVKYRDHKDLETGIYITQITFGRSQTTEFGNLKYLIQNYIANNGIFASELKAFLPQIGRKPSLASNKMFCDTLIEAAIQDPIMRDCQDDLFDSFYYQPALGWFNQMGFTLPLSLLVIYDSHIHSGSIPVFLRKRFSEIPPVKGGNEKKWISEYANVRHDWLSTHPNKILNNTVYRTECFKKQIERDNWQLDAPIIANGIRI